MDQGWETFMRSRRYSTNFSSLSRLELCSSMDRRMCYFESASRVLARV